MPEERKLKSQEPEEALTKQINKEYNVEDE